MVQKDADLLLSFLESYGLDWVVKHRPNMLRETLMFLYKEVYRLKSGEFTPEEFQNFCGDCTVQDGFESFVRGCREYQKKLFNGRCDGTGEAMFCDHANEVPARCSCDANCYCKTHTCKARNENKERQSL